MAFNDATASELHDLYDNAPCGYHSVDAEGFVLRMNTTELDWLGHARADVIGRRRYADFVCPRGRREYRRAFESLRAKAESVDVETSLLRKDGSAFDALLRIAAVRAASGAFLHTRATVMDISARKRAETAARGYAEQLRAISQRVVEIQESERRRLSAELHDRIGQDLAVINLNLHIIKDQLPADRGARLGDRLDDSIALVEGAVETVRDVAATLRPPMLDDYGLTVTLRSHAEQFTARTGIRVDVESRNPVRRLPADVEMTLFRIGQEALANVLKHAQARRVRIALNVRRDSARLTIADDGCGFDAPARLEHHGGGLGLLIMRERLRALNGALRIRSSPGAGTRLTATIGRA